MNNINFCPQCGTEITLDAYCTRCNQNYGVENMANVSRSPFMPMRNQNQIAIPPTRLSESSAPQIHPSPYLANNFVAPSANQFNQPMPMIPVANQPMANPMPMANQPMINPMPIINQTLMPNLMPHINNPQRKVAFGWLIFSMLAMAAIGFPFVVKMDMMNGGFALAFISFFLVITGFIASGIYFVRAKTLDKLLSGQDLLAYWTYTPNEWHQYTETEFQIAKGEKVPLLILTSVICLVIGGIFAIADPEAGLVVFVGLLGLVALLSAIVFIVPRLRHEKNKNSLGYAFIGSKGVYLNGVFHNWNMLAASVEAVSIETEVIPLLAITYSYPTRTGRQEETVRIPIPQGQIPIAQNIVRYFQANGGEA